MDPGAREGQVVEVGEVELGETCWEPLEVALDEVRVIEDHAEQQW
jgi:hypothetical protein